MTPEEKTQLAAAEQIIRTLLGAPQAAVLPPPAAWACPIHGTPAVFKSGTSRRTGQPYGFWTCPGTLPNGQFCDQRPPRANGPVSPQNGPGRPNYPEVAPDTSGGLTELP